MTRSSTPLRWLAALLLLAVLATGLAPATAAQQDGFGTPTAIPADLDGQVSIGEDTAPVLVVDQGTPAQAETPEAGAPTETPSASPSETPPSGGIGSDSGGDVSTGEGTPVPEESPTATATESPTVEASPSPTETEVVHAAAVGVSATIYLCSSSFGGGDPAGDGNCSPASGVGVSATADGTDLGSTTTNGAGVATFDAPDGSAVVFSEVTQSLPSGYVPDGNGSASVTASSGANVSIANIQMNTAGRLQISNGQCPTSGEARTQFIVVGPLAIQAASIGCEPRVGASLTVTGPGGSYSVVTGGGGGWVGTLPVGTYSISNGSGSESIEVESGSTTIVLVVDFVPGPKGTLTVERFDCSEGDEGTTITVGGGPNNASCLPSDKSVQVASTEGSAQPLVIDLGANGSTSIDVAAGDYVVTDGPTGVSAAVTVAEGSSVIAAINSTIRTGVVSASLYWCEASVSGSVNPSTWGNWTGRCARAGAGTVVTLLDGNGNVVSNASTGGDGTLSFGSLVPGTYSLTSTNGCALFANGADARNGFVIAAGDRIDVVAFGCADPSNVSEGPAGPGPDPGTIGGSDGSGSESGGSIGSNDGGFGAVPLGNRSYHTRSLTTNPLAGVSTLPATGEGDHGLARLYLLMLLGLAAMSAGVAANLASTREKRSIK